MRIDARIRGSQITNVNPTTPAPTLQYRLDELITKVDLLIEAVVASETSADAQWQQLGETNQPTSVSEHSAIDAVKYRSADQSVASIGAQFAALRSQRDALEAEFKASERNGNWTAEREEHAELHLNPLSASIFSLAQELATVPAADSADLRFKALAIKEFAEEKSNDVVHNLALSLAADILAQRR